MRCYPPIVRDRINWIFRIYSFDRINSALINKTSDRINRIYRILFVLAVSSETDKTKQKN
jgi:hypothetical protein